MDLPPNFLMRAALLAGEMWSNLVEFSFRAIDVKSGVGLPSLNEILLCP